MDGWLRVSEGMSRLLALSALGLMVVTWSADGGAASRRPYGGTLRWPLLLGVPESDPTLVQTEEDLHFARQLHANLFKQAGNGGLLPALAQKEPEIGEDGRTWLIHLRPKAVFQDGAPVTVEDVIASWENLLRIEQPSPHWWLLAPVEGAVAFHRGDRTRITGLERTNRKTLRIRLRHPLPGFADTLAALPTAIRRKRGSSLGAGAGPFLAPTEPGGSEQKLVPFLGHWRGRPFVDQLLLRPFDSIREAQLAFELGKLDALRPSRMDRIAGVDSIRAGMDNRVFLALNPKRLARLPTGFRRALDQAIDRRRLADYVLGDRAVASDELLSFGATGPRPEGPRAQPEEARSFFESIALKQLGLPAMFEFIVRKQRPLEHDAAERIQMDLNEVGVSVFVVPLAAAEYRKRVADGDFDFRLVRQLPLVRDGEMQLLGVVAQARGAQAVADLLDELGALSAGEDRAGIVRERARGLLAQLPWLPLFIYRAEIVHRSALRGLFLNRSGAAVLASVWLAE